MTGHGWDAPGSVRCFARPSPLAGAPKKHGDLIDHTKHHHNKTSTDIDWWRTGVIPPAGSYQGYWTDPYTLFTIEVVAMQFAELKRLQDFRYPGSQGKQYFLGLEKVFEGSGNPAYPGGPWFNMFNLGKTEAEMKTLKLKEIKNGRLAMLAMLGYGAQAVMTQKGPFQNLVDHLSAPTEANILTNFANALSGN